MVRDEQEQPLSKATNMSEAARRCAQAGLGLSTSCDHRHCSWFGIMATISRTRGVRVRGGGALRPVCRGYKGVVVVVVVGL